MTLEFLPRLRQIQENKRSMLCVGLDPDPDRLPQHLLDQHPLPEAVQVFTKAIIEATAPVACAFKLNFAFYEALGREGWDALEQTLRYIPDTCLTIGDAKRGDIGNTARFYAESIYDQLGCDAATVAPYMGRDAVEPFLQFPGKAVFVLARTSNASAQDFQEQDCGGEPLYERVARHVVQWDAEMPGTAGLVVGATNATALKRLRDLCPTLPFLIPGIGAQGGDPDDLAAAATGNGLVLVNSSRSILYASDGEDFAGAAGQAAEKLRQQLDAVLASRA